MLSITQLLSRPYFHNMKPIYQDIKEHILPYLSDLGFYITWQI